MTTNHRHAGPGLDLPPEGPPGLPASRARRRILAVGLLAAAVATIGLGVVAPVVEGLAERAETEAAQRALLARLQRTEAEAPALRRAITELDADLAGADTLLRAPSASQGLALLQAIARQLLEAEGIRPESTQPLPPAPQGAGQAIGAQVAPSAFATVGPGAGLTAGPGAGQAAGQASNQGVGPGRLTRLSLRLEFRAGLEPLHRLFQAIESHRPVLAVRDAQIVAPGRGGGVGASGASLAVRLELLALARVEAADG